MKKILSLLLSAVALLCFTACGQGNEPETPATPEELIIGSWLLDSASYTYADGTVEDISNEYAENYTMIFNTDGSFSFIDGDQTYTYAYHFSGNGQLILDYTGYDYKEAYTINTINETTLILEAMGESAGDIMTLYLTRKA